MNSDTVGKCPTEKNNHPVSPFTESALLALSPGDNCLTLLKKLQRVLVIFSRKWYRTQSDIQETNNGELRYAGIRVNATVTHYKCDPRLVHAYFSHCYSYNLKFRILIYLSVWAYDAALCLGAVLAL